MQISKAKLLVIGLMLGFDRNHAIFGNWGDIAGEDLLNVGSVTKDDFFALLPGDKSFFEYDRTWKSLRKIFDFVEKQGERITIDDFKKVLVRGKSAIDLAVECKAIDSVFEPAFWVGHLDDMTAFWYCLEKIQRPRGKDLVDLRMIVARLEQCPIRETRLKEIGIEPRDVYGGLRQGSHEQLNLRMVTAGDRLTLADAKVCDADGDHGLYSRGGWERFEVLYDIWEQNGEIPDAAFFLFRNGKQPSIIDAAFTHSCEAKVFNARVFAGRPDELLKLYRNLKDEQRGKIDIFRVLADVIEQDYAKQFVVSDQLALRDLHMPIYRPGAEMGGLSPLTALGLKTTWEQMDAILPVLAQGAERLTLQHLRLPAGLKGENGMVKAALYGRFDKVVAIALAAGERFDLADLIKPQAGGGPSIVTILARSGQIESILDPQLWVGRSGQLVALWEAVPEQVRIQTKPLFQAAQNAANRLSLQNLASARGVAPVFASS